MGAIQKLPANQHSQSSLIWVKMGQIDCAIHQVTSTRSHDFFHIFKIFSLIISIRTHKPEMPAHFCHLIFQLQVVCFVLVLTHTILDTSIVEQQLARSIYLQIPSCTSKQMTMESSGKHDSAQRPFLGVKTHCYYFNAKNTWEEHLVSFLMQKIL